MTTTSTPEAVAKQGRAMGVKAFDIGLFDPNDAPRVEHFADGDLPKLPTSMQNALRSAAAGVKLDELPVLIGRRDLASQGKER